MRHEAKARLDTNPQTALKTLKLFFLVTAINFEISGLLKSFDIL